MTVKLFQYVRSSGEITSPCYMMLNGNSLLLTEILEKLVETGTIWWSIKSIMVSLSLDEFAQTLNEMQVEKSTVSTDVKENVV